MKSFKKSIVFLMAASLVFGTVAPAFAATPSDVVATDYEDAVGKMVALGIINGYEDGTFQPEKSITRAEFAKIACYVVGQQSAANLSKGSATKFSDVPSTHWASGFVSVASSQGLLKGYPNGTFKPEANVTYAEAVTILVRALGMAQVVEGKGTWPANYMAKASEVGMFDEVTGLVGTDNALRGNIAKLSWNTLEADKWGEKGYNDKGEITYGSLEKSLLSYGYKDFTDPVTGDVKYYEDKATVVATRVLVNSLNDDEVVLSDDLDGNGTAFTASEVVLDQDLNHDGDKVDAAVALGYKFETVGGVDFSTEIGCDVDVMLGKDNKVAFAKSNDIVVNGKITEVKSSKVVVNGKEYEVNNTSAKIIANYGKTADIADLSALKALVDAKSVAGRLVIDEDNNKVKLISVVRPDAVAAADNFVVEEIKSNGYVMPLDSSSKAFDLDELNDNDSKDRKETVVVKNAKVATKADIKVGDHVLVLGDFIFVTDSKVTGKVTGVSADKKLTINGTQYALATGAMVTKTGKLDDVEAVAQNVLTSLLNKDVTVTLNNVGDYTLVNGVSEVVSDYQYAIVKDAPVPVAISDTTYDTVEKAVIVTMDGLKKTVYFKGDSEDFTYSLVAGDIIEYTVRADGSINPEKVVELGDATGVLQPRTTDLYYAEVAAGSVTEVKDEAKSIKFSAPVNFNKDADIDAAPEANAARVLYFSDAKSVILNANATNAIPGPKTYSNAKMLEKVANWDAIVDTDTNNIFMDGVDVDSDTAGVDMVTLQSSAKVLFDENNIIKLLVINIDEYVNSNETKYAVVTGEAGYTLDENEDTVMTVELFTDGAKVNYQVIQSEEASFSTIDAGDVIGFTVNSDGDIKDVTDLNTEADAFDLVFSPDTFIDASKYADSDNDVTVEDRQVKSFADNIVTLENNVGTYRVKSDAKVYDLSGTTPVMGTVSSIKAGNVVEVLKATTDGLAEILVIVK